MSSAYDIVMKDRQKIVDKLIAQMEKGYVICLLHVLLRSKSPVF